MLKLALQGSWKLPEGRSPVLHISSSSQILWNLVSTQIYIAEWNKWKEKGKMLSPKAIFKLVVLL